MFVFYPPRLIKTDDTIPSVNARLDDARERYLAEGVVVIGDEESVKSAQKIINFSGQFEDLKPGRSQSKA